MKVFEKFLAKFKKELVNFNGNYSQFKSFSLDIDEMLKSKGIVRYYERNPELT